VTPRRAAPPARPAATLLVSTYNWPRALALVLDSALAQRALPSEVVVADDGSGEETRGVVEAFAPRFAAVGVGFVHAWHPDEGFRLAAVRNLGLARATGDYVLQVDGDCVLHPDFVGSHLAFARPGAFVQGSRVMVAADRTARALAEGAAGFAPFAAGLRSRQNGLSLPFLRPLVRCPQNSWQGTRGCNMAYWRADAVRVNGFDTRIVGWGREDVEFSARLLAAGLRRRRLKFGGIVYHLHHPGASRAREDGNQAVYEETLRTGRTWCEHGIVSPAPAAAPAGAGAAT
jgi:glycosyltransferase involved in cell wall biosynthesis